MNYLKLISNIINIFIYFISILGIFIFSINYNFFNNYINNFLYIIILISILSFIYEYFQYLIKNKFNELFFIYGKSFIIYIQINLFKLILPLIFILFIYFLYNYIIINSIIYIFIIILSIIQFINIIIIIITLLFNFNRLISSSFILILNIPNISLIGKILYSNIDDISQEIFIFICLFILILFNLFFLYYLIIRNKN